MATRLGIRTACVQFADPDAPDGIDITVPGFLDGCRKSALARFSDPTEFASGLRTLVHTQASGSIVLHVDARLVKLWESLSPGAAAQQRAGVERELQAALEELAAQGVHGLIAFTEAQRALFVPDLVQAVTEALERTSFAKLGRAPKVHWEGTLVERVKPPMLSLVVSLGL